MRKLFLLKFSLLLCFSFFLKNDAISQQYHSIPTAIKNLQDEGDYVDHLMANELLNGTPEYTAASEKRRFISMMIYEINKNDGVNLSVLADQFLPKRNLNEMQVGVKYFDSTHTGTTSQRYIRQELMSLISY